MSVYHLVKISAFMYYDGEIRRKREMKRLLCALMCLCLVVGLAGCSTTPREELIGKFANNEDEIDSLTDEEVEDYLKYATEYPEDDFVSLQEKVFLNDENTPPEFKTVVETFNETSKTAELDWRIKNFNIKTTNSLKAGFYDVYMEGVDTNVDLILMYDTMTGKIQGMSLTSDGQVVMSNSYYYIALCTILLRAIEPSVEDTDAVDIVEHTLVEPVLQGNYYFSTTIDDGVSFVAVPVGE